MGLWALGFLDDGQKGNEAPDPRPVAAIDDRALRLGVDHEGTWLVWSDSHLPVHAADRLVWLLPLLKRAPDDVIAVCVDPADTRCRPWCASRLPVVSSDYWRRLALG